MAYRSIVVGTDGSVTATGAVRHAAELARAVDAQLTVVSAFERDPTGDEARARAEAPPDLRWMVTEAAAAEKVVADAKQIAREAGVSKVVGVAEAGEPAEVVLGVAAASGDCIVVGSVGMTGAKRFVMGSVPNRISHHAPCDVIIVPTAD